MKFVCFNTKVPKVGVVYDVLDDKIMVHNGPP